MATTPPSTSDEPLTLDQVKLNLRLDPDDTSEDDRLQELIVTAREHVESETDLVLVPRVVTETARELGRWIDLASWPVTRITAIRYPVAGVMTPLAAGSWIASYARRPVRILPTSWAWGGVGGRLESECLGYRPAPGHFLPIEIDVEAGYATPADVPMRAKQAMHLLVASWYANRSAVESGARAAAIEIPLGVDALLDKLRLRQV